MSPLGVDQSPALTLRVRRGSGRPVVVVLSAKVFPKAVTRNTIRRRISEAFRRVGGPVIPGRQCVVYVRHAGVPSGRDMDRTIFELLVESGIVVR